MSGPLPTAYSLRKSFQPSSSWYRLVFEWWTTEKLPGSGLVSTARIQRSSSIRKSAGKVIFSSGPLAFTVLRYWVDRSRLIRSRCRVEPKESVWGTTQPTGLNEWASPGDLAILASGREARCRLHAVGYALHGSTPGSHVRLVGSVSQLRRNR